MPRLFKKLPQTATNVGIPPGQPRHCGGRSIMGILALPKVLAQTPEKLKALPLSNFLCQVFTSREPSCTQGIHPSQKQEGTTPGPPETA